MLVSYCHNRYELSGTMDTDKKDAEFIFTRRPLTREDETILPPEAYRRRYLDKIANYDGLILSNFEVLEPSMTGSSVESFNQPRIRIGGSIYFKEPAEIMCNISGSALRYLGGPVTIESLAVGALQSCTRVIVSEFEGFIIPRNDSMRL